MNKNPLSLACEICDCIISGNEVQQLEPIRKKWFYAHALFMCGLQRLYELTSDVKYLEYTKEWADSKIDENGEFYFKNECIEGTDYPCFCPQLDSVQPGLPLFKLYEIYEEGKYRKAIENLYQFLLTAPTTSDGGYYHYWYMNKFPSQMWLDGLYMAEPFTMEYYLLNREEKCLDMIWKQIRLMTEHNLDENTGLLYHGWDESKNAKWADKETGRSKEFWGRSIGWYCVTLADILEEFPKDRGEYQKMLQMFLNIIDSVIHYQDKSGLWFQVIDKASEKDNWTESSCTCLFLYSLSKGLRLGLLSKKYEQFADSAYNGVLSVVKKDGNKYLMENISTGVNVGDYDYYVGARKSNSDLHGIGSLILALTEYSKIKQ